MRPASGRSWHVLIPTAILLAVGLGVGAMFGAWTREGARRPPVRVSIPVEAGRAPRSPRLSPDGTVVAFIGAPRRLFLRNLSERTERPVPGSDGVTEHAFSPDSRCIAFRAPGGIFLVDRGAGSTPAPLAADARGIVWIDETTLIGVDAAGRRLVRIPTDGGTVVPGPELGLAGFVPRSLGPEGGRLLGTVASEPPAIASLSLASGEGKILQEDAVNPVPHSYALLFAAGNRILGAKYKTRSNRLDGTPVELEVAGSGWFDAAADGSLVYLPADGAVDRIELLFP